MIMSAARKCLFPLAVAVALGACTGETPPADAASEKEAAREAIWAKEQAVYAARRRADPQFYIDNASEQYVGWSPNWDAPEGLDLLRAGVSRVQGQVHEELSLKFEDIAVSGDAAVIYYSTHRTRLPTGEDVNQRFQIAHSWVREGDEWKLLGALGRGRIAPVRRGAGQGRDLGEGAGHLRRPGRGRHPILRGQRFGAIPGLAARLDNAIGD